MSRTLYISQKTKPLVKRDGPSVWIKEEGRAGRRIPVRLVGRVIIIGNVRLDAGTIILFSENNVPITFMNNMTEEAAVVLPYNHKLYDHYKEQRIFLYSEGTISHFQKWAESRRLLFQINLIRRYLPDLSKTLELKGFGEGNYQKILKGLKKVGERKWFAVNGVVTAFFRNMIMEGLINAGLDPHLGVIHRRHNFGLALDICYIMGGESDIQTLQFFRSKGLRKLIDNDDEEWAVTDEGIKNIVHRFENRRGDIKEKIDKTIDDLFDLIREMLS